MTSKLLVLVAFAAAAVACGGKADTNESADGDFQIDEAGSSLVSDAPDDDGASDGADGCQKGDHDHKGHRKHRFKALDLLDGVRDRQITLAALPADLSPHLLEKLHALDANTDGVVTKDEMKARRDHDHERHGKKHHEGKDHDDDRDDDDGDDREGHGDHDD